MKRFLALLGFMALAACGEHPATLPPPPKNTEVVDQKIPVPVLCKVEIERAKIKLDEMKQGKPLEEQDAAMRQTIAQQQAYILQLEGGIIGCGGKIK